MSEQLEQNVTAHKCRDRVLWRAPADEGYEYYANSIHVTENKDIGINVGGTVIVKPLVEWHECAQFADRIKDRRTHDLISTVASLSNLASAWPLDVDQLRKSILKELECAKAAGLEEGIEAAREYLHALGNDAANGYPRLHEQAIVALRTAEIGVRELHDGPTQHEQENPKG